MESARAVPGVSPDIGRADTVDEVPSAARVQASTAIQKSQRSANDAQIEDQNSPTPTLETLRENFRDAVQMANERLADRGASINISIDQSTNAVIVQVKDRDTGDTIRQIPPESALQVSRNIERLTGILVDRKV